MPSKHTVKAQKHQRKILPLADRKDFAEAKKGLMAVPEFKVIKTDKGGVSWDFGRFDFLLRGKDFDSIHTDLEEVMISTAKMADMVKKGKAKMEGNPQVLKQLVSTMTEFDPWFEILPGTKKQVAKETIKKEVFEDKALVGQAAAFAD